MNEVTASGLLVFSDSVMGHFFAVPSTIPAIKKSSQLPSLLGYSRVMMSESW